ncbi:UbiH 2-polyprenyl-6-methoxyphenol hydroxylase and related FAD-dependent oxidoreductases [Methylophilaceae bacterium]
MTTTQTLAQTTAPSADHVAPLVVDVTVVGAGLVGLAAALACHQAGYSVALLDSGPGLTQSQLHADANSLCNADSQWDARIYAISPNNAKWLVELGAWPLLDKARLGQINTMQIFADGVPMSLDAEDESADCLAYVLESRALAQALHERVSMTGMPVLVNLPCVAFDSATTTLHLADKRTIQSGLVIAADGSQSWLRQQLGIAVQKKSYAQLGIVANFSVELDHAHVARQWFTSHRQDGGTILAWLPLSSNTVSIVWSVPLAYADELLALSPGAFTQAVMQAGDQALGDMQLLSPPVAFALNRQTCERTVQDGVVLVGDAAHQIHPMAGQGVNLGFRDVIDLLATWQTKNSYQSLADSRLLKAYTRRRKADVLSMQLLTDGLFQLFARANPVLNSIRNAAWQLANQGLIKKTLLALALKL